MMNENEWKKESDRLNTLSAFNNVTFPLLGKIVFYEGEYGIILRNICSTFDGDYMIRWDTNRENDCEQYGFFDCVFVQFYEFKWINLDGTLKSSAFH